MDYGDGIVGYSCLASGEVVLYKYQDDIHYVQRVGVNQWEYLGNLSRTGDLSSYPQGFVYGRNPSGRRLFTIWTERAGDNYLLIRNILNLPEIVAMGDGVEGESVSVRDAFSFEGIYSNPTRELVRIRYISSDTRPVSIKIYDIGGRLVYFQEVAKSEVGLNELLIKLDELSSGVYFVRLEGRDYLDVEKVILLR